VKARAYVSLNIMPFYMSTKICIVLEYFAIAFNIPPHVVRICVSFLCIR